MWDLYGIITVISIEGKAEWRMRVNAILLENSMNKKEFKNEMLCGLGRCVLACRKDPERYRSEVLWGCTHQLAYDAQCEGTHAWFLHELVSCYPDKSPFRDAAINALFRKSMRGWLQLQIEEFLHYLADDGDKIAEKALWDKYAEMYSALLARKRRPTYRYFNLRDDFEFLAMDLSCEADNTLRITSDMGRLMRENPIYDCWDFGQFFWQIGDSKQLGALRKYAKQDECAAYFLAESEKAKKEDDAAIKKSAEQNEQLKRTSPYLFSRKAEDEAFRLRAETYKNETDPEKRADLLRVFIWRRPFPLEPDPIIKDAASEHELLRENAWYALHIIHSPKVREFALRNLDAEPELLIPLLITNYTDEDKALLERLLTSIPKGEDGDQVIHHIGSCVNDQHDIGLKAPAWILRWFYENDRCSCCREYLVREMGRRRLLTDEMIRECLYDANDDIREYANKKLKTV